jgi:hypothetical protein
MGHRVAGALHAETSSLIYGCLYQQRITYASALVCCGDAVAGQWLVFY